MPEQNYYQQLAEAVEAGDSEIIYKIFKKLIDTKEAKVLLAAEQPATVTEIAGKSGINANEIKEMIEPLFKKGLLFKSNKPEGIRYYRVQTLAQMRDTTATYADASQDLLDLWKKFMAKEWPEHLKKVESVIPQPVTRVVSVNVSIEAKAHILAFDDVKSAIDNARSLAVIKCPCRVIDGSCGKSLEVCIQINKAADYALERGIGRKLERVEAIEILKKCEEEGLVHVGDNRRTIGEVICNCCSDCCRMWPSIRGGLGKYIVPSRFAAQVDVKLCTGCETCMDRCYFDAISVESENNTAIVDLENCMGCGLCIVTCPEGALSLKETRPEDFIPS